MTEPRHICLTCAWAAGLDECTHEPEDDQDDEANPVAEWFFENNDYDGGKRAATDCPGWDAKR